MAPLKHKHVVQTYIIFSAFSLAWFLNNAFLFIVYLDTHSMIQHNRSIILNNNLQRSFSDTGLPTLSKSLFLVSEWKIGYILFRKWAPRSYFFQRSSSGSIWVPFLIHVIGAWTLADHPRLFSNLYLLEGGVYSCNSLI